MTMTVPPITAEWICTRCGATNRKLVPPGVTRTSDACYACHSGHEIAAAERPVRWTSRPTG